MVSIIDSIYSGALRHGSIDRCKEEDLQIFGRANIPTLREYRCIYDLLCKKDRRDGRVKLSY